MKAITALPVAARPLSSALAQSVAPARPTPADLPSQAYPDPYPGSPVGIQLPGQKWLVHDRTRPQVRKVMPGLPIPEPQPSSDSVVLFDGKDLLQWQTVERGGQVSDPKWTVDNGHLEMVPSSGSLITKQPFGDRQLHLEWMTPTGADSSRKDRCAATAALS